ncbi:MAG: cupredoxin domain-containing protein [Kofleriaceae bacterium]|nr:cupredoxin domain-containing protein [Kofleriaceae bacterium]MBP6842051.1 cupredoxin domain-containing protein [Kofleriaceae bacterium]MBP9202494.1 cupredoxin domain-containing protein [Kofleriaceae bacterium]
MGSWSWLGCVLLVLLLGCDQGQTGGKAKPGGAGAPGVSGPAGAAAVAPAARRRVAVEAGPRGFVPDRIAARPGEVLLLVVTRTEESDCLSQLAVGGAAPVALPMNSPVEIAVTAPSSGTLTFACGMDMFRGAIVVDG